MYKNIIKFIAIWFALALLFIAFAVYRDVRINKLFNYTSAPKNIVFEEVAVEENEPTSAQYNFVFRATDNYLGAVLFPIRRLGGIEGEVIFKIKESGNIKWFHENRYDYNYFSSLSSYIFGFPVIENSSDREYQVSIGFTSNNNEMFDSFVEDDAPKLLLAKYVFPRKIMFDNPGKLVEILRNRVVASAKELDYVQVFTIIIILALGVLLVSNSRAFGILGGNSEDLYKFTARLIKPRYSIYFFIASLVLLVLIPILILLNRIPLAEKLASYLWSLLLLGFLWYLINSVLIRYLQMAIKSVFKLQEYFTASFKSGHFRRNLILAFLVLILVLGLRRTYYLGGDDSRLFYLYPKMFLENFAVNIVSDTSMSSIVTLAPPVTAPFAILMTVLKLFIGPLNLQSILYAANLLGGFVFFYLLISWLVPYKSKMSNLVNLIASFSYVFSTFNIYTLFNSKLIAIYLVSTFPFFVYLFLKAVKEKKPGLLFILAIVGSLLGFFFLASPWSLAALITIIPIVLCVLWKDKMRTLKYLMISGMILFILNFHWIIYLPYSSAFSKSSGVTKSSVVSADYRQENSAGIRTVSEFNSVFYPLMNTYSRAIQEHFDWSYYPIFLSWSAKILPLNIVFMGLILIAGISIKKNNNVSNFFVASILSFLLAVYFYTVNITGWGTDAFIWLNNNVPGFVLFRNMYDKFAFAIAFNFALLLGLSLNILSVNIQNKKLKNYLVFLVILIVLINAKPFLLGEYNRTPIWTTKNTYDSITAFNDDFVEMTDYISKVENPGKYIVLPLTTGNAFPIQDKFKNNHYYNGVSPLLTLTGKNDFSGLLSFGKQGEEVRTYIKTKNYSELGKTLQKFNAKYIIVNRGVNDELAKSYVYSDGFYFLQDQELISSLVGKKIKDFGQSYSLYEINELFDSEKIYLTGDKDEVPSDFSNLRYSKIESYLYELEIKDTVDGENLIFLDPYLEGWELVGNEGKKILNTQHFMAQNYANGWSVDNIKGLASDNFLKLYYKPQDYYLPTNIISIIGYFLSFVVGVGTLVRKKQK